ncbi:MAG: tRNA lysidine(34) synthetase TilS [Pirellulales bacterium]|nr:tRNA lysidine(34) synthetase TilS [Pirellulales bacterium]
MVPPDRFPKLPREAAEVLSFFSSDWQAEVWRDVHVAIALSGGGDSVALLRLALMLKERAGGSGRVFAFHVNHRLRGEEADRDARWCRKQCKLLGVELTVLAGNAAQRAAMGGDGLEAGARNERYDLLIRAAEQVGARYLATAHTREDQAETVLFRLLRGSGLRGLRGIPASRKLSPALTLVRPLLTCSRELLVKYLDSLGQSFCTDSSNADHQFTRNRLRHDLLPNLRTQYNSNLDSALVNLASQAKQAEQILEQLGRQLLEQATIELREGPPLELSIRFNFRERPTPLVVTAALRLAWREAHLPEQGMTYEWWVRLASLLETGSGEGILNLPGDVRACVSAGKLLLQCSMLAKDQ